MRKEGVKKPKKKQKIKRKVDTSDCVKKEIIFGDTHFRNQKFNNYIRVDQLMKAIATACEYFKGKSKGLLLQRVR